MTVLVFDKDLMRPACVLLQAAMGGDQYAVSRLFDAETWLVSPTPGMARYEIDDGTLRRLAAQVNAGRKENP